MKFYTHPVIKNTFIRYKDGSSYYKNWRYNRPSLILEVNVKTWSAFSLSDVEENNEVLSYANVDEYEVKNHKLFIYSSSEVNSEKETDKENKGEESTSTSAFYKKLFSLNSTHFQPKEGLYSEKNFW